MKKVYKIVKQLIIDATKKTRVIVVFSLLCIIVPIIYIFSYKGVFKPDTDLEFYENFYVTVSLEPNIVDEDAYYNWVSNRDFLENLIVYQDYKINDKTIVYQVEFDAMHLKDSIVDGHKVDLLFQLPENCTIRPTKIDVDFSEDLEFLNKILKPKYKNNGITYDNLEEDMLIESILDSLNNNYDIFIKNKLNYKESITEFNETKIEFELGKNYSVFTLILDVDALEYLQTNSFTISNKTDCVNYDCPINFSNPNITFSNKAALKTISPNENFKRDIIAGSSFKLVNDALSASLYKNNFNYSKVSLSYSSVWHESIHEILMILLPMLLGAGITAIVQVVLKEEKTKAIKTLKTKNKVSLNINRKPYTRIKK